MPKPADPILTWVSVLDPDEELAARLALCRLNSWCRDDPAWIRRIEKLRDKLIKTDADRENYVQRSSKIAREIKQAGQAIRAASGIGSDTDTDESSAALSDAVVAALRE